MARRKKKSREPRQAVIITVTGTTGTGKTWFTRNLILEQIPGPKLLLTKAGMQQGWENIPIIDSSKKSDWEYDTGIRHVLWMQHGKDTARHILKYSRDKTLILDDAKEFIPANLEQYQDIKWIFSAHRHLGADMVFIAHSINDIPPQAWMYTKLSFVFHTDDMLKSSVRTSRAKRFRAAQDRVTRRYQEAYQKGKAVYGIYELVGP